MSRRNFEISKIKKTDNPFASTTSISIQNGVFIKDIEIENAPFLPNIGQPIKTKLITDLESVLKEILEVSQPKHIMILCDFGQGKSYSFKHIQTKIYEAHADPIISLGIPDFLTEYKNNKDFSFLHMIVNDLTKAFNAIPETTYPKKSSIKSKYQLDKEGFDRNLLQSIDKAFSELQIRVYIFIDELDKIVTEGDLSDSQIKNFLEILKTIADECSLSISLWVAGTKNCQFKIDSLGLDYSQRFKIISSNLFNKDKTKSYIKDKCKQALGYIGYMPFDSNVLERIYQYTDGNIRYIESICRELWNFTVDEQCRISQDILYNYFKKKLYEPIKTTLGNYLDDCIIDFITPLVFYHKYGKHALKSKFSQRKIKIIDAYLLNNSDVIKIIFRSYQLNTDIKEKIIKEM